MNINWKGESGTRTGINTALDSCLSKERQQIYFLKINIQCLPLLPGNADTCVEKYPNRWHRFNRNIVGQAVWLEKLNMFGQWEKTALFFLATITIPLPAWTLGIRTQRSTTQINTDVERSNSAASIRIPHSFDPYRNIR